MLVGVVWGVVGGVVGWDGLGWAGLGWVCWWADGLSVQCVAVGRSARRSKRGGVVEDGDDAAEVVEVAECLRARGEKVEETKHEAWRLSKYRRFDAAIPCT